MERGEGLPGSAAQSESITPSTIFSRSVNCSVKKYCSPNSFGSDVIPINWLVSTWSVIPMVKIYQRHKHITNLIMFCFSTETGCRIESLTRTSSSIAASATATGSPVPSVLCPSVMMRATLRAPVRSPRVAENCALISVRAPAVLVSPFK